jgi:hypothetical protein
MHESSKVDTTPATANQNCDPMDANVIWDAYLVAMQPIVEDISQNKVAFKKLKPQDIDQVRVFLFHKEEESQTLLLSHNQQGETNYRHILNTRKEQFLADNHWNTFQHDFAMRCLTTLVSTCARQKTVMPMVVAWSKIVTSGMTLRPNYLSNLLFVTSLEDGYADMALQIATCHASLYGPTESSIFLRIKSHVAMNDLKGAEALLQELPVRIHSSIHRRCGRVHGIMVKRLAAVSHRPSLSLSLFLSFFLSLFLKMQDGDGKECKRLRTFMPILECYCTLGDAKSIVRIWEQIRSAPGAHIDSRTYALIICSLARNGVFQLPPPERKEKTFGGPELLDHIMMGAQKDILEILEEDALDLFNAFKSGFQNNIPRRTVPHATNAVDGWWPVGRNGVQLMLGRVNVDAISAVCPATGAKLQLQTLDEGQRTLMRDTLVEMAEAQQKDFAAGKKYRPESGGGAKRELLKFEEWLQ